MTASERHSDIRDAVRALCAQFPDSYHRRIDAERGYPDAFVVSSSIAIWSLPLRIAVRGSSARRFRAFRTSEDRTEQFQEVGTFEVEDGAIVYDPPTGTTTTFIAVR